MNTSLVDARARKLKSSVSAPIRRVAVESLSNGQSIGLNPRFLSRPSLSTHLSPTDRPSDYWICPIPLIIPNPAAAVVERNALGPRQERCNQYGSLETLRHYPHTPVSCAHNSLLFHHHIKSTKRIVTRIGLDPLTKVFQTKHTWCSLSRSVK